MDKGFYSQESWSKDFYSNDYCYFNK